jgi:hypothetical protein
VRCRMDDACAYDGMSHLWPVHAMPLVVALMAVGGALNVGSADLARAGSECLTCKVDKASEATRPSPLMAAHPASLRAATSVGTARKSAPLPTPRGHATQIFSGFQMTKFSAFGIFTLGSVSAFITSFSPMILLSERM